MPEIKVLSQEVADKIAAGEVAERPSAVVKELVENAMDAGADRISIEIKHGGVQYIRVTDNGCGIPADQAETAFLRHATSKLRQIDDLYRVATMGFRGEALASICAVAEVELITKTEEAEEGIYLQVEHGAAKPKEPVACNTGTTIVVKELFANVPARMKFLKKDSTEAGYCADLLGRIALSRPEIAFEYLCDEKEVFSTTGDGDIRNVVLKLYGMDHAKALLDVDYTEENIRVTGVIGKPEVVRGNRTRQTIFVNGRYIKNHVVSKIVEEAYRNAIMVGKFPFFVLNLGIAPECVDVNVHPAKTEVKFSNEKRVYDIVYHAVKNAIYGGAASQAKPVQQPIESQSEPVTIQQPMEEKPGADTEEPAGNPFAADGPKQVGGSSFSGRLRPSEERVSPGIVRQFMEHTIPAAHVEPQTHVLREDSRIAGENGADTELAMPLSDLLDTDFRDYIGNQEDRAPDTRIIGQVFDTYLITQVGEEMFLIDQHAAHERLRFEDLKEGYQKKERLSQMLLTPVVLNLGFSEAETILRNLETFQGFGFEIEDFGSGSVIVRQTPIISDEKTIRDLVLEIADALAQNLKHPIADFEEKALDMISCKYAIKANKRLTLPEMADLVKRVDELESRGIKTCPHGRPVKVSFTKKDIEKLFKRIV